MEKRLLTVKEAADYMSMPGEIDYIYDLCKTGKLRYYKKGRRGIRIDKFDLDAHIEANKVAA